MVNALNIFDLVFKLICYNIEVCLNSIVKVKEQANI